ncbi:hypothetical protein FITA111629_02180 [Filibacter tadaridae]|uniref:Swarming motility protein SwrB n=1 Tax=Filibacter tadaridae TaxID=2483811 RepID=A0A3P5XLR1_9BACL|nr:hypothetical protein [Filibacter tadaridae]VDC29728.1 hypothetical protein FILTAD_02282 [Filibacter tadaridae]
MIWTLLIILFLLQIIGFYFMAILYTKITKFDDLEKKQRKLMTEMDDSIGAYLAEIKDENERLIERLSSPLNEASTNDDTLPDTGIVKLPVSEPAVEIRMNKPTTPMRKALKSYKTAAIPKVPEDDHSKAIQLHDEGLTTEEIAKKLDKGLTEVELILKFR